MDRQARQFLGDVDAQAVQHDFLTHSLHHLVLGQAGAAGRVGEGGAQPLDQSRLERGEQFRGARLQLPYDRLHPVGAIQDHAGELAPLALAARGQFGDREAAELDHVAGNRFRVGDRLGEHARPAHQVGDRRWRRVGGDPADFGGCRNKLRQQSAIDRRLSALGRQLLQRNATLDLAARHCGRDQFAQWGLGRAQLVRHPETEVEEARVDASQLEPDASGGGVAADRGVAGHASYVLGFGHGVFVLASHFARFVTRGL